MPVAPLYRTVHDELKGRILSGIYAPGAGLPAERRQGRGSFVPERGRPAARIVTRYRGDRTRLRGSFTVERGRGTEADQ